MRVLQLLEMILVEAPSYPNPRDLYRSIAAKIKESDVGEERDGRVSDAWTAGISNSRHGVDGKTARLLIDLKANKLDPESKQFRDAKRVQIAFDTLASLGLVRGDESGRYIFPSSGPAGDFRRRYLSDFRQVVAQKLNDGKEGNDYKKVVIHGGEDAINSWTDNLSPEKKELLRIYGEMDRDTFVFLKGLIAVRKQIANYRHRIKSAKFEDSLAYGTLRQLNMLGADDKLNMGLIRQFGSFIKDPDGTGVDAYAKLKPFERAAQKDTSRFTADRALARNEFNKNAEADQVEKPETMAIAQSRLHGIKGDRRAERTVDRKATFKQYMDIGA